MNWARPIGQVRIDFDDASSGEELHHDVSAAARIGDTLFLACDETATVEVMHRIGVRRWGFHGASHRYIAGRMAELLGRDDLRLISCHLGGSSSLCAIDARTAWCR